MARHARVVVRVSSCAGLALAVVMVAAVVPVSAQAHRCLHSGNDSTIKRALRGRGARVALCPRASFVLHAPVQFTATGQRLYTNGHPRGATRAHLTVASDDASGAAVVIAHSRVGLSNVVIDGGAPHEGLTGRSSQELIAVTKGSGQDIDWVDAAYPRGGSNISCVGAERVTVRHGVFGPAGRGDLWPGIAGDISVANADGITWACPDGLVADNTIVDPTDIGIAILGGSRGSTFTGNTVLAAHQGPGNGIGVTTDTANGAVDHSGVTVENNVVDAQGAPIRVGLTVGVRTWCDLRGDPAHFPSGGKIVNNVLRGAHMGYGYAISGATNWTISGNRDESKHSGLPWPMPFDWCTLAAGASPQVPTPAQPGAFQYDPSAVTGGTLQSEFAPAQLDGLLSVCWPGDMNNDGRLDAADVQLLQNMANSDDPSMKDPCRGDLNRDGVIDGADVALLKEWVAQGAPPGGP